VAGWRAWRFRRAALVIAGSLARARAEIAREGVSNASAGSERTSYAVAQHLFNISLTL